MKVVKSGAAVSRIVEISENLKRLSKETEEEYLPLDRGVNQVVGIDLDSVARSISLNSPDMQTYPPSRGSYKLREAVNREYFLGKSAAENILITVGGTMALDLAIQSVGMGKLYLPSYYWGSYRNILAIRGVGEGTYGSQSELENMIPQLRGNAVLICDPGNPIGEKHDDDTQFSIIKTLSDNGITVIFDSPYRHVFTTRGDDYYSRLLSLENVVITESFSKSMGLCGQRIGFIHTTNPELTDELHVRLMYTTNGISSFIQRLVLDLFDTEKGRKTVAAFRVATCDSIAKNIAYLRSRGLLAEEFYEDCEPTGIFAVVRLSDEELLKNRIGSVPLSFFTADKKRAEGFARICVSVPHEKFVAFFNRISK